MLSVLTYPKKNGVTLHITWTFKNNNIGTRVPDGHADYLVSKFLRKCWGEGGGGRGGEKLIATISPQAGTTNCTCSIVLATNTKQVPRIISQPLRQQYPFSGFAHFGLHINLVQMSHCHTHVRAPKCFWKGTILSITSLNSLFHIYFCFNSSITQRLTRGRQPTLLSVSVTVNLLTYPN